MTNMFAMIVAMILDIILKSFIDVQKKIVETEILGWKIEFIKIEKYNFEFWAIKIMVNSGSYKTKERDKK